MTEKPKLLRDGPATEFKVIPNTAHDLEEMKRIDAAMAPVYELLRHFQRERDHQPFTSQAPCPICGGTVTYQYRAPLVGGMKCDTPGCIRIAL
ncbi:hypothetical protein FG93_03498 [Bosea sp. LC85]|uniref:hypothetical protein n=1 Tax=Bosea sp. LC85 TaxID=1502851 RepID=UPI0004E3C8EC|nr:hypothetical protein [Bosea sp. LC85]KFC68876.1 hypothetical protein FG93_03498 [Bosea sp. LC85]